MIRKPVFDSTMDPETRGALNNLIAAVNAITPNPASITVSGNTTLTNAQFSSGILLLGGSPGAGFNLTLPVTTDITRELSGFLPMDNTYHTFVEFVNQTGQQATLVAGDVDTTLVGSMTVPTGQVGRFLVSFTSGIAISIRRQGLIPI